MLLHTDTFTQRHFYTQTLLTKTLLHTGAFTHRSVYTQTLLHTKTFTHSHTEAFTHRRFDTQALLHKHFYIQTLLHTNSFTHRRFYTQKLLHADAFTHRSFYTQTLLHRRFYTQALLHTITFTYRRFYTQTLLHTGRPMFTQSQWSHRCRGHLSNSTEGWSSYHVFGWHAFNIVQSIEVLLRQLCCSDISGRYHDQKKLQIQLQLELHQWPNLLSKSLSRDQDE